MARTQNSPSTLMRRSLESQIAEFRQQISVCQSEISLREKVLHDLDALEGRTTVGVPIKTKPVAVAAKFGLTDAIREIFGRANAQLSATEIREQLLSLGFAQRSNFLVMIHSTLSRLAKAGEIERNKSTGKWFRLPLLRSDSNEQKVMLSVPARSASQAENKQLIPLPSASTERSTLTRAEKVELTVRLRKEGKTNKEIAKALGMETHDFQNFVTPLIKRKLLERRDPGRRARSVDPAAGESL